MKFHFGWRMDEDFFKRNFPDGIAYKIFGRYYEPPATWNIQENSLIESSLDTDVEKDCSFGVNIATIEWLLHDLCESDEDWSRMLFDKYTIWKVKILEDAEVVVANWDGKIRCDKIVLLEKIDKTTLFEQFNDCLWEYFSNEDE